MHYQTLLLDGLILPSLQLYPVNTHFSQSRNPRAPAVMDRKWRTNRGAINTVQSVQDFEAAMPPADAAYTLASTTDLYAVYTVLHIECKESELRWSPQGSFYYFLAVQRLAEEGQAQPAAPEGDEDMPQQVGPQAACHAAWLAASGATAQPHGLLACATPPAACS